MKLVWAAHAKRNLEEISDYIAADDPRAARMWIDRLRKLAKQAARVPGIGRRVPEYNQPFLREVNLRTYRLIYALLPPHVVMLMVVEGHKRLPPLHLVLIPEP